MKLLFYLTKVEQNFQDKRTTKWCFAKRIQESDLNLLVMKTLMNVLKLLASLAIDTFSITIMLRNK